MDRGARPRTDASEGKSRDGGRTGTPGTLYMNRLAEGMKVSNSLSPWRVTLEEEVRRDSREALTSWRWPRVCN